MELSSRLAQREAKSKWPELNFISFISLSTEILRHGDGTVQSNSAELIGGHLEALTSAVTSHCITPVPLKALLKLYSVYASFSETVLDKVNAIRVKNLQGCLPKLFLSSPVMKSTVAAVLQDFREDKNIDEVENGDSLSRLIARKAILFLMKYGTLLKEES